MEDDLKKKKYYKLFSILILLVMFIVMCLFSTKQSFWIDELDWTIDYLAKSNNIVDLLESLLDKGFNLPLFYIVMFPIYKIVPYGEFWLLLPNFVAIICGILIISKIGKKIGGDDLGFASLCMAATSYVLIEQGAFEFRPYAFLFCFSAFTLYRYICRLQEPQKIKNDILYAISLILLSYTHWFGCLTIAFYFFADVFFWIRKKFSIRFIWTYIVLGVTFLPWLILMMLIHTNNLSEYWANIPSLKSLCILFVFLLSNNALSILLLLIGISTLLYYIINKNKNSNLIFIMLSNILWSIITIFIYSKYINPKGSLWVERYFFIILPQIFIITAIPIYELIKIGNFIKNRKIIIEDLIIKRSSILFVITCIIIVIAGINYYRVYTTSNEYYEPYREASNIIANTKEAYQENSALITSAGNGYLTYYFEKQGYKLPSNVFEEGYSITKNKMTQCVIDGKFIEPIISVKEDLLKYDILYLFEVHEDFKEELLYFINEKYQLVKRNEKLNLFIYEKK